MLLIHAGPLVAAPVRRRFCMICIHLHQWGHSTFGSEQVLEAGSRDPETGAHELADAEFLWVHDAGSQGSKEVQGTLGQGGA